MNETNNLKNSAHYESEHPLVASDVLIFTTKKDVLQIVLKMRDEFPCIGKWSIPGTFIRFHETAEDAARRCLLEMAGMKNFTMEQLHTFSALDRNPEIRTIAICYISIVPEVNFTYQKDTVNGKIAVFDINREGDSFYLTSDTPAGPLRLEPHELALDHGEMIRTALSHMKRIIDTAEFGFRFLPDPGSFTLTDLRHIYDAVKGTRSDIGNFRRFIKNRYIDTGKVLPNNEARRELNHAGRPAETFRFER